MQSNVDDELLLQLLFDLASLRPLQQQQQLLLLSTTRRMQEPRGPLPAKVQQKVLLQLASSRAAGEQRHCFAVLQLQWEALGLLQQALQWGIGRGQPAVRFSAALSLLQWCLRLQRWFSCETHAVAAAAAAAGAAAAAADASNDAAQQQRRVLCRTAEQVGCLLLDFLSRALEQLLLVALPPGEVAVADAMLAARVAAAADDDESLRNPALLQQQYMRCFAAVFASDAVVSPSLVLQLSQEILPSYLCPRTAAELLLQPATRQLLPPLLEAVSTACRVCPFVPLLPSSSNNSSSSSCCLVKGDKESGSSGVSGAALTEGMLQLMQQLLLLLPHAVEADAQQKDSKAQPHRRRAASAALSLSAAADNPTTPSALQALRSCGDWLALRLGALREALQQQPQQQQRQQQQQELMQQLQQQHDYLERQLIALVDWTFALRLGPPAAAAATAAGTAAEGDSASSSPDQEESPDGRDGDIFTPSAAAAQQLLLQDALRLAAKAFPTHHPAHR